MNFVEELRWRGMLHDMMPGTEELLAKEQVTAYIGFDPTADSLHIGHLCSVMILRHFQRCGHKPMALIGGATGMIGDPSGKSAERNLLTEEILQRNLDGMKKQLSKFLDFESDVRLALDARTLGQGIDIDGRHRKGPERVGPVGEKQCGRLEPARPFGKARERRGGVIEDGEDGGADRAVFQKTERRLSEPRTQHAVLEREVRAERHARLDPVAVVLKAHHRRGAGGLSRRCARILKSSRTGSC